MMERGSIRKERGRNIHTGVFFPAQYELAMSSLAYQKLYYLLNSMENVLCDRFILGRDTSIEHNLTLRDIKVAFVTVPYIMNVPDVIEVIERFGLREDSSKVLCIGGISVVANPRLFQNRDAILFYGSIESHAEHINMLIKMVKAGFSRDKIVETIQPLSDRVAMGFEGKGEIEYDPPHSVIYTNETEFSNMHLVEISRGCAGNCNFCMSKHIYSHYREFKYESIISAIDISPKFVKRIGLIGDAVLSHSRIADIVEHIIYLKKRPSFASIRIADLLPQKIPLILKSDIKTLTIAPEVATEKLMKITNKFYDRAMLFDALKELVKNGVMNLKLYLMIGLPKETKEDIDELIDFIKEVREVLINASRVKGRLGMLRVSINNFVPSPFTPLFSSNPDDFRSLEEKQMIIKKHLSKLSNLTISTMDVFDTLFQTALFKADYDDSIKILRGTKKPGKRMFMEDNEFAVEILRLCYK